MFNKKGGGLYFAGVRAYRTAVVTLLALSFIFVMSASIVVGGTEGPAFRVAPLNPEYLKYKAEKEAAKLTGASMVKTDQSGHRKGYIPPPIDFSYLRKRSAKHAASVKGSYPSAYDLRTKNKVPPVKNQSQCGSCWAHAAIASIETALWPTKVAFSEEAIMDMHGYDPGPCDGGWQLQAIAVAARQGVISQKQYPYQYLDACDVLPTTPSSAWTNAHVQNVDLLDISPNPDGTPYTDDVKSAVMTHNTAVAIAFYAGFTPSLYNSSTCAEYDPNADGADHAVAIIGWNDNYSASNFATLPPGDGAYLVRNSWAANWGLGGYFWLSYWDQSFAWDAYCYYGVESATNYNWTYQYDTLGWTGMAGYQNGTYGYQTTSAWMANVFRANPQGSHIKAVSFYVPDPGTNYTIQIYDRVPTGGSVGYPSIDPATGNLMVTVTGTWNSMGYHTVKFSHPVQVTPGQNFSVVVGLDDPNSNGYPIAIEQQDAGFSTRSEVYVGQSFASPDGQAGNWTDLATYDAASAKWLGYKVCVKAFGS
jgi:C1A family cysteine protease